MITGSKILFNSLVNNGVKHVFGYSGGAILPVLNEFYNQDKIQFIMSRTEIGASFMAEGYAKSKRKCGVVMTTSGPGALNTITSLQNSLSDGTPILVLSGQVATSVIGTGAFQEANVIDITKHCTKWNSQITDFITIDLKINLAFDRIFKDRYGPVLIDLPKNIMSKQFPEWRSNNEIFNFAINNFSHRQQIYICEKNYNICPGNINSIISISNKPVILAGQGVFQGDAINLLREFARSYNIPVTTTLLGLGIFDEKDPLSLRMCGMHGSFYANNAIQNSDLLINFGSRFDDRITGNVDLFAPNATIIHIDILKENINKTIKTHYLINDNCHTVLKNLLEYKKIMNCSFSDKFQDWHSQIRDWKKIDFSYPINSNVLQGRHVISTLNTLIQKDCDNQYTIVADVGAHQMWTAQFIQYNYPKIKFITSGGLGSMGFAIPASIGVKIAIPTDKVIVIVGDGGFTMSMVELLTAIDNKVNIKILIINNNNLSMVSMWQKMFYDSRYIATEMVNPPFEKICENFGCKSILINNEHNLEKKLQEILDYEDGPIVANIITYKYEPVLPMVSPGKALDDMIIDENNEDKFEGDAPC